MDSPELWNECAERDRLFAAAVPWVWGEANRLHSRLSPGAGDLADLAQEGLIAAWGQTAAFDPRLGVQFRTFAQPRVVGAMIDWLHRSVQFTCVAARRRCREGTSVRVKSLSAPVPSRNELPGARPRVLADLVLGASDPEPADPPAAEFGSLLRRLGVPLTPTQRAAVTRYFVDGLTLRQVGDSMGLSESRISQIVTGFVGSVRDRLQEQGRTRYTAFA